MSTIHRRPLPVPGQKPSQPTPSKPLESQGQRPPLETNGTTHPTTNSPSPPQQQIASAWFNDSPTQEISANPNYTTSPRTPFSTSPRAVISPVALDPYHPENDGGGQLVDMKSLLSKPSYSPSRNAGESSKGSIPLPKSHSPSARLPVPLIDAPPRPIRPLPIPGASSPVPRKPSSVPLKPSPVSLQSPTPPPKSNPLPSIPMSLLPIEPPTLTPPVGPRRKAQTTPPNSNTTAPPQCSPPTPPTVIPFPPSEPPKLTPIPTPSTNRRVTSPAVHLRIDSTQAGSSSRIQISQEEKTAPPIPSPSILNQTSKPTLSPRSKSSVNLRETNLSPSPFELTGSGKVVAMGSTIDAYSDGWLSSTAAASASGWSFGGKQPKSPGVTRSLTRKVSTKFKKLTTPGGSGSLRPGTAWDASEFGERLVGRMGSPTSGPADSGERSDHSREVSEGKEGKAEKKRRAQSEVITPGGKIWRVMKRISVGALRERYNADLPPLPKDEDIPPVPKLPLDYHGNGSASSLGRFKAICEAGMVQSDDGHGMNVRGTGEEKKSLASRFTQSRPSLSAARAPARPAPVDDPPPLPPKSTAQKASSPPPPPRPSTTTGSSSPTSGDSIQFASTRSSARSSISSLVDESDLDFSLNSYTFVKGDGRPMGKHILSPKDLEKFEVNSASGPGKGGAGAGASVPATLAPFHINNNPGLKTGPRASRGIRLGRIDTGFGDDWASMSRSPLVELPPSLPPPPRLPAGQGEANGPTSPRRAHSRSKSQAERSPRSSSPIIPSFSTTNAINTFLDKKSGKETEANRMQDFVAPSAVGNGGGGHWGGKTPTSATPTDTKRRTISFPKLGVPFGNKEPTSPNPSVPPIPHKPNVLVRTLSGASRTRRARPRSSSLGDLLPLASTPASMSSDEREKMEKWNDLLAKTGGGTIHLAASGRPSGDGYDRNGVGQLASDSDSFRLSDSTEQYFIAGF